MKLSKLQKYILVQCLVKRGLKIPRKGLPRFYENKKIKPKTKNIKGIITKSLERLIDKELLVGYGRRTPKKWFIEEIRLTNKGKKEVKKLFGQQQVLPLHLRKVKKKK